MRRYERVRKGQRGYKGSPGKVSRAVLPSSIPVASSTVKRVPLTWEDEAKGWGRRGGVRGWVRGGEGGLKGCVREGERGEVI